MCAISCVFFSSFLVRYSPWTERAFRTCRTQVLERLLPRGSAERPAGTARFLGCCRKAHGSQRCSGRFLSSWVLDSAPTGCSDAGWSEWKRKKEQNGSYLCVWLKTEGKLISLSLDFIISVRHMRCRLFGRIRIAKWC